MKLPGRNYYFRNFRLDTTEQLLFCADKPVHLTLKAFAVLRMLVEDAGHIVEKEELMRHVWPDAIVEDDNLTQAVCQLRRTLGDNCDRHEYIETVSRRGYRFDLAVTTEHSGNIADAQRADAGLTGGFSVADEAPQYGEAHRLYLRGIWYWAKYTVDGLNTGIDYFNRAIKADPEYPLPYVGLGNCYYRLANIHLPPDQAISKAKAVALRAIEIDDTRAEGHALLGLIKTFYDRDWEAAEKEFKRAIELDPHSAVAHKRYGWALGLLGRFDEGITEIKQAIEFKPKLAELRTALGIILHLARRYDEAIAQADMALDSEPEFFPARVVLGRALVQQVRLAEAIKHLEKAVRLENVPWVLGYLGYAYGLSGRQREALSVLSQLEKQSEKTYVSPHALVLIHTGLNRKQRARELLVKTSEERNELMAFAKYAPEFDGLRFRTWATKMLN